MLKTIGKFLVTYGLAAVIIGGLAAFGVTRWQQNQPQQNAGAAPVTNVVTLAGKSTNAILMPTEYVMADATTTVTEDGGIVTQLVSTAGIKKVHLDILAVGNGVLNIRPMSSEDGTNYFDWSTTTQPFVGFTNTATTSVSIDNPYVVRYVPSAATSTKRFTFLIPDAAYTRFLFYTVAGATVQAWIEAVPVTYENP